jgi:F0F1-type ATP synthase epsilon subunit
MRFFIGQASDLDLIPTRGEPFSIREEDILVVEANVTSGKLQIFEGHSPLVAVIRDDVVAFQDFGGRKS